MRSTTWIGVPHKIDPGITYTWANKWGAHGSSWFSAKIYRFVFRALDSAVSNQLPEGLVCSNMKVKLDLLPVSDRPHVDVLASMGDWVKMIARPGDAISISVTNNGSQPVTLDVGVEYEVLGQDKEANEGVLPGPWGKEAGEARPRPKKISDVFAPGGFEDVMHEFGVALGNGMGKPEVSYVLEAAGSFIAKCFNVLEERLVGNVKAPRREETVLTLEPCTIEPGQNGQTTGTPQLPFKATRWFLEVKAEDGHAHAIDDLIVEGLYVGNFFIAANGTGTFPASVLSFGNPLAITTCPVSKSVRVRLRNNGKEKVTVGGYVIGEVCEVSE